MTQIEVRDKNLAVLRSKSPALAKTLSELPDRGRCETLASRTGLPVVRLARPDGFVHLASVYDPVLEAHEWVAGVLADEEWECAIIFGLGAGYHVDALLDRAPTRTLIIVEPDVDVLAATLAARDLRNILSRPNVTIVASDNPSIVSQRLMNWYVEHLHERVALLEWPPTARLHKELWLNIRNGLTELARQQLVDIATTRRWTEIWIDNLFANLRTSITDPGVSTLFGLFRDRPCIVVGAGPSLDKNGHLLPQAKGRAILIAAGSAINALLSQGVEPDLVVSIDPGEANYRHFANVRSTEIPLVYAPTLYPRIVAEYQGPRLVGTLNVLPFASWLFRFLGAEKGAMSSGPSVANTAWDLARLMGCNPIILVGLDLAYTDDRTHAEGAVHARKLETATQGEGRYIRTLDIWGKPVLTSHAFEAMRIWFQQRVEACGGQVRCINATEGGIGIPGVPNRPLAEVLSEYCGDAFAPREQIIQVWRRATMGTAVPDGARVAALRTNIERQLSTLKSVCVEAFEVGKSLTFDVAIGKLSAQRYSEALNRFRRLDRRMGRVPLFRLMLRPVLHHVFVAANEVLGRKLEREQDIYTKGRRLATTYLTVFGAVHRAALRIEHALEKSL